MFIKTVKQKNKDGSIKLHYYVAHNSRKGKKMVTKIIRRATPEDLKELKKNKGLVCKESVRKDVQIVDRLFKLVDLLENPPKNLPSNHYWKKARRPKQIIELLRAEVIQDEFNSAGD